ncbi:unnamed protein product [Boreogadus saida]
MVCVGRVEALALGGTPPAVSTVLSLVDVFEGAGCLCPPRLSTLGACLLTLRVTSPQGPAGGLHQTRLRANSQAHAR